MLNVPTHRYVFRTTDTVRYRFPTHTNDLVMDRSEAEASEAFMVVLEPGDPRGTLHRVQCEGNEPMVYLSVDCFTNGRPAAEPTWESHVRVLCKQNGWDFDAVRRG